MLLSRVLGLLLPWAIELPTVGLRTRMRMLGVGDVAPDRMPVEPGPTTDRAGEEEMDGKGTIGEACKEAVGRRVLRRIDACGDVVTEADAPTVAVADG